MNLLIGGCLTFILGCILVIMHRNQVKRKESYDLGKPYLRNLGIGFILFGIYNLVEYILFRKG